MVYERHMPDGIAFSEFAEFIDDKFALEYNRIIVYKWGGETLELEVCAVDVMNTSRERLVINQEESLKKIVGAAGLWLSDTSDASQLYAFTTYTYQTWNSRTLVFAKESLLVPN